MVWKWKCGGCEFTLDLPENKLPPFGEIHGKDGTVLTGWDCMDISKVCQGVEFRKVEA